ncbi:MAG TPA: cupin domain-containing protein [Chlamydiales bacterium]|nr:cupin domain-containing protein [Chlamydiales bacterium]
MQVKKPWFRSEDIATYKSNGSLPNSHLPVLIYRRAIDFGNYDALESQLQLSAHISTNDWYVDWLASIYKKTHYHSNAHEALAIFRGEADLALGGNKGHIFTVSAGDVVFIPAGVGHRRVSSSMGFLVFGLYPNGQKWNMRWVGKRKYPNAKREIAKVPIPKKDPLYGSVGLLLKHWK